VNAHYHPYSEEFLLVVEGEVTVTVDGQDVVLGPQEAVFVPIGATHRVDNRSGERCVAVFQLGPLAPEPRLGHVDVEEPALPNIPHPTIAGR
jgi:putative monooxygenase